MPPWKSHASSVVTDAACGVGAPPSARAAVAVFAGGLYVFVQGADNGVYVNRFSGASWSGWSGVPGGGLTPSSPGAAVHGSTLYLLVRGGDNGVYRNILSGSGWGSWKAVAGGLTPSGPGAGATSQALYLVVRGIDSGLYLSEGR